MIAFILAILFALWNGLVIKWYLTKDQKWSKYWHGVGMLIRAVPLYFVYPHWGWMLLYCNVAYTIYDEIINLVNGWGLGYIGTTSALDRKLGKWSYALKAVLLLITIIYYVI